MSDSLANVLKTVDNIKSAWELGNSEMVAADRQPITRLSPRKHAETRLCSENRFGFGRDCTTKIQRDAYASLFYFLQRKARA